MLQVVGSNEGKSDQEEKAANASDDDSASPGSDSVDECGKMDAVQEETGTCPAASLTFVPVESSIQDKTIVNIRDFKNKCPLYPESKIL